MGTNFKSALAAALCATTALTSLPGDVFAGPMTAASKESVELAAPTDNVHYRRYYHRHRRYHRYYRYGYDPGGALFAAAALGIMGAGIAAASRPYYGWGYPYGGWGYPGYYGWGW